MYMARIEHIMATESKQKKTYLHVEENVEFYNTRESLFFTREGGMKMSKN